MSDNYFLSPVVSRHVTIPATDGKLTLSGTLGPQLFLGPGCEVLRNYISPPTRERELNFHSLIRIGKIAQIFGGFGVQLQQLSCTVAQFCAGISLFQNGDMLLLKIESEGRMLFFVVRVYVFRDGSIYVNVDKIALVDRIRLSLKPERCIVTPQLPIGKP